MKRCQHPETILIEETQGYLNFHCTGGAVLDGGASSERPTGREWVRCADCGVSVALHRRRRVPAWAKRTQDTVRAAMAAGSVEPF